jgi:hypothetical protein
MMMMAACFTKDSITKQFLVELGTIQNHDQDTRGFNNEAILLAELETTQYTIRK